jgi:hypothetical protein
MKIKGKADILKIATSLATYADFDYETFSSIYTISFFDHWLTEDEAEKEFEIITLDSNLRIANIELQILGFFTQLKKAYNVVNCDSGEHKMVSCDNLFHFIQIVNDGLREHKRFVFFIEELSTFFVSGYDRDVQVYLFVDNTPIGLAKLITEFNLNLLNSMPGAGSHLCRW